MLRGDILRSTAGYRGALPRLASFCPGFLGPLALTVALFAFSAATVTSAAPSHSEMRHTIVFFGDSLTAGYGLDDPATESYPAVVQRQIDAAHLSWRVVDAGLSGETSAGGLRRVDWILRQHVDLFFLALGANDGLRGIEPSVTQANLVAIIGRVRAKYPAAKIVLAGMQMPAGMGEDFARRYDAVFPTVAASAHVTLLPFLLEGVAGRPELNQADGIHPNAAGHRLVAENVWKTLHPLL